MEKTLELIGSIRPGQKFYLRNGILEIDPNPGYISSITWRWYTKNNRNTTIEYIQNIIKQAIEQRVSIQSLDLAKHGLENLMITYKSDKKTVGHINKILGFLEYEIKNITRNEYIWRSSSVPSNPISFPPSQSCAITVSTGAKGQILSTSLSATSDQFNVGSLPKFSKKR